MNANHDGSHPNGQKFPFIQRAGVDKERRASGERQRGRERESVSGVAVRRRAITRRDCEGKVRLRLSRTLFSFFLLAQISLLFATSIFCVLRKKHRPLEMALAQPAAKKDDDREDDGEVTLFVPDLSIYLSTFLQLFVQGFLRGRREV